MPAQLLADLGCALPPDEYMESGDPSCEQCKTRMECTEPGHGRWYIGLTGKGFRTDRCARSWADSPFVWTVQDAHLWAEKPGGVFRTAHPRASALLLQAMAFYSYELGARRQHDWELSMPKEPGK